MFSFYLVQCKNLLFIIMAKVRFVSLSKTNSKGDMPYMTTSDNLTFFLHQIAKNNLKKKKKKIIRPFTFCKKKN